MITSKVKILKSKGIDVWFNPDTLEEGKEVEQLIYSLDYLGDLMRTNKETRDILVTILFGDELE